MPYVSSKDPEQMKRSQGKALEIILFPKHQFFVLGTFRRIVHLKTLARRPVFLGCMGLASPWCLHVGSVD
jgi:hypothetical protein